MGTTADEIRGWIQSGKDAGATHVIVACDTFDNEDYPVNVMPSESIAEKIKEYDNVNMQRIMEVYAMHLDLETQLAERRAYHPEIAPKVFTEAATTGLEHRITAESEKP